MLCLIMILNDGDQDGTYFSTAAWPQITGTGYKNCQDMSRQVG